MSDEKVYQFNEYVLGYDSGIKDKRCLTISKIQNGNMYVMGSFYDEVADIISNMLDSLQTTVNNCKERIAYLERSNDRRENTIISLRMDITNFEDIIYKLEKWLNESRNISLAQDNRIAVSYIDMVLDKLKELKGEDENG